MWDVGQTGGKLWIIDFSVEGEWWQIIGSKLANLSSLPYDKNFTHNYIVMRKHQQSVHIKESLNLYE